MSEPIIEHRAVVVHGVERSVYWDDPSIERAIHQLRYGPIDVLFISRLLEALLLERQMECERSDGAPSETCNSCGMTFTHVKSCRKFQAPDRKE